MRVTWAACERHLGGSERVQEEALQSCLPFAPTPYAKRCSLARHSRTMISPPHRLREKKSKQMRNAKLVCV